MATGRVTARQLKTRPGKLSAQDIVYHVDQGVINLMKKNYFIPFLLYPLFILEKSSIVFFNIYALNKDENNNETAFSVPENKCIRMNEGFK